MKYISDIEVYSTLDLLLPRNPRSTLDIEGVKSIWRIARICLQREMHPILSFTGEMLGRVFLVTRVLAFLILFLNSSKVAISRKLFTVARDAPFITLNREASRLLYRSSVTSEIQASAIYQNRRFQIYDSPCWYLAHDMVGLLRMVVYTGFI